MTTSNPPVPEQPEVVHTIDPGPPLAPGYDPDTVISPRNPAPPEPDPIPEPDPDAPLDLSAHTRFAAARPDAAEPFNVLDGRPHFLRITGDGAEACGQDGKPWPCPGWQELNPEQPARRSSGPLVDLELAASAAGMTVAEFQAALATRAATGQPSP